MCRTPYRVRTSPHSGSLVLYCISFKIQHDPAYVLTMCGVQFSGFFFFVALRSTCVMLSRYISGPVAFDRMTLSAHSLSRVQTQITHSLSSDRTRLIILSHELRLDSLFPVMTVTRLPHPLSTVQDRLPQSLSRVQTQIPHSLSRAQARFAPQGFWPSCPQALAPYPIPGSYLTPSRISVLYYISFKIQHNPAYVRHVN